MMIYVDKDGSRISKRQWAALRGDQEYVIVRHYLNDRFRARVEWVGETDGDAPPEHWTPFSFEVHNILRSDSEGRPITPKEVLDPNAGESCRTASEAVSLYEHFLCTYAGCEWLPGNSRDENGAIKPFFLEKGNRLAPLSKDVPVVDEKSDPDIAEIAGSW